MTADPAPLLALAGLILVKESGVPIPVPGDLVVLGAGVTASHGDLDPLAAVVALIAASILGGTIQFGLLRSIARPSILRLAERLGTTERVERQTDRLRRGGARGVAVARMTPGIRIVAIAASALAGLPAPVFLGGLIVGNAIFIGAHFGLGFVLGPAVVTAIGAALGPLAVVGFVVAAIGAAGWIILGRRRRATDPARAIGGPAEGGPAGIASWADACCPACLAIAVMADRPLGNSVASS
jgi:membrane protein DedA with SNARE-associated domain